MENSNPTPIPFPWLMDNINQLSQSWLVGRFHHGLLLQGVEGCGKSELMALVSKGMLCHQRNDLSHCNGCKSCLLVNAQTHPDLVILNQQQQAIGIDDIRLLARFVHQTAQLGRHRVIVIHRAELLTLAAANALLKTLEEPNADVFIVMSCNDPSLLLPTIVSRCFKMAVVATDPKLAFSWLNQQLQDQGDAITQANFDQLFRLANRAPLKVLQWIKEDKIAQSQLLTRQFNQWRQGHLALAQFRAALAEDDFALLMFVQLMLDHLQQYLGQKTAKTGVNLDKYMVINQIFSQLSQFSRDGVSIIGQNKTLALIELLNQLDSQLKLINS